MVYTPLNKEEQRMCDDAIAYIRHHRTDITNKLAGDSKYISHPALSMFMAGSPGAGKTETSKNLLSTFDSAGSQNIIRLDPDDIRELLPHYKGGNAHVFQQPITIVTDQIFNYAIKESKNVLVDGTFSNYDRAYQNVSKSLKKNRVVIIIYSYVDPVSAWKFTQAREAKEGRKITKEVFVDALFNSKANVKRIKSVFGKRVEVYTLIRDYLKGKEEVFYNADDIDKIVNFPYTEEQLENLL